MQNLLEKINKSQIIDPNIWWWTGMCSTGLAMIGGVLIAATATVPSLRIIGVSTTILAGVAPLSRNEYYNSLVRRTVSDFLDGQIKSYSVINIKEDELKHKLLNDLNKLDISNKFKQQYSNLIIN